MGRMSDMIRNGDPRQPASQKPVVLSIEPLESLEDNSGVPFIEVGAPRMTIAIADKKPAPRPVQPAEPKPVEAEPGGFEPFHIHFEPVILGFISGRDFGAELVCYHEPEHVVSQQYAGLHSQIADQLPGSMPRSLAFVGYEPGAGTSTVLLNLAIAIARKEGVRVVVADANRNHATLAQQLGIASGPGLCEAAMRKSPIAWSLQETHQPFLSAISFGRPGSDVDFSAIAGLVDQLREHSDWLLIDCGTWTGDAAQIAEKCDAVYLVASETGARSEAFGKLQSTVFESTGRLRGTIQTLR